MRGSSPALIDLMVELHQLRPADRRAILERLEPDDRGRIEAHLLKAMAPPEPSFDALAGLSPWLVESLAAARSRNGNVLTPATSEALNEAERLLPRRAAESREAPQPSLLDRLLATGRRT
jgi:hypothetical protein